MALKKTVVTPNGFEALDAYHRVEGVRITSKNTIAFQVRVSKDGVLPHFSDQAFLCDYDINGANPIAQAYLYIKTLPEFFGASDC